MLAIERHRLLLELLNRKGAVRTAEAAEALGVTEETVRRDFEKLGAEGALMRSHGGAVRVDAIRREVAVAERAGQNAPAKLRIARAALGRIRPGQTVVLDASTTVLQLARLLPDQPLKVLTNSLPIALALAGHSAVQIVVLGGNFVSSSQSCNGWSAEQMLDGCPIDTAFLSCRGLDADQGPSEAVEGQARLKRRMIERAGTVHLLADSSKAGARSGFFFSPCSEIDVWITERPPAPAFRKALTAHGVRIEVAGK